jgi:secretion/DNA translocation related TadE-like protein
VLVLGCLAVLTVLAAGWVSVGRAALARQRAETAADLAALAGAAAGQRGADPCGAAAGVAARNAAALLACAQDGDDVLVTVQVSGPMRATSHARAGPQDLTARAS